MMASFESMKIRQKETIYWYLSGENENENIKEK